MSAKEGHCPPLDQNKITQVYIQIYAELNLSTPILCTPNHPDWQPCQKLQTARSAEVTGASPLMPCRLVIPRPPVYGLHRLPVAGVCSRLGDESDSGCRNPSISISLWLIQSLAPPTRNRLLPPWFLVREKWPLLRFISSSATDDNIYNLLHRGGAREKQGGCGASQYIHHSEANMLKIQKQ